MENETQSLADDVAEAIAYLENIRKVFMNTPEESLGGEALHDVMGNLAIVRNIIDGLVLDLKDLRGAPSK